MNYADLPPGEHRHLYARPEHAYIDLLRNLALGEDPMSIQVPARDLATTGFPLARQIGRHATELVHVMLHCGEPKVVSGAMNNTLLATLQSYVYSWQPFDAAFVSIALESAGKDKDWQRQAIMPTVDNLEHVFSGHLSNQQYEQAVQYGRLVMEWLELRPLSKREQLVQALVRSGAERPLPAKKNFKR